MVFNVNGSGQTGNSQSNNHIQNNGSGKTKFKTFMKGLGKVALAAGKAAMTMLPGADAVNTFFNSVNSDSMMGQNGGMTPYEMLGLQQSMLQEARMFTVLSNVMKVRHDAAMNAIRNIK